MAAQEPSAKAVRIILVDLVVLEVLKAVVEKLALIGQNKDRLSTVPIVLNIQAVLLVVVAVLDFTAAVVAVAAVDSLQKHRRTSDE